ncbi:hypothetical protein AB0Q95_34390 [Streptomyces sp. NPDC059900]|uniref:hypothetical protein n=1 Tax=Streptomyces sp. NPDC059900 TaxID=3155816 RepID=UPI003432735A
MRIRTVFAAVALAASVTLAGAAAAAADDGLATANSSSVEGDVVNHTENVAVDFAGTW